jgi:uncharacterized repeat protein (TIGR01451 family)
MRQLKYILAVLSFWLAVVSAYGQTQTLGISQSQSGNPTNGCGACYTISIQYSISNVAATGTTIVATFPNNVFDLCNNGGASSSVLGTTTTLTFNLGSLPTSASSVSYQIKFKSGTTCNGTNGALTAKISTIEHPVPVLASGLTLTAVSTEGWNITKYIANSYSQWYSGYGAGNPFAYTVSICGATVDVYYHIRVYNNGCINLKNSSVTDNLPAGATVAGIHTGWPTTAGNLIPSTTGVGTVTWNVGNGLNTLDANTGAYSYYVHITFPVAQLNTVKCNSATLNATNVCTNAPKTVTSNTECITLIGATPTTTCGIFGTQYYYNPTYYYFIGCNAWLNIALAQANQCVGSTTTLNNISYNTPIPVQMHVNNFNMSAIPAGKFVTITINTTCGTYTQTYTGPLAATNVNFYAAPYSLPPLCVITNFALSSNMSITGNASVTFGQLGFTVLTNTWNTNAPILPGTTVTMTGAAYNSSNGSFGCAPSFVTSAKMPRIESIKDFCPPHYQYYNCVNPNDTIKYSIAVQNYGTANFSGGSIRDVLPVGLKYVPNSSTFGKYTAYTKCNSSNQAGTGISVAHAESAATTNLQWNLPTLTADCNAGSEWYVINFKVVVTTAAPAGVLTNHEDVYDGSNVIVPETPYYYNGYNNNAFIYVCERKVPLELTKDVSKDNINWDSCVTVSPGSSVYYRLKVKNAGNVAFSQIKLIDLLPSISDKYVVNCNSRGSTMPIYLTSALPLGNASTIEYSTNQFPTRGALLNLIPDNTVACNSVAGWLPYLSIPGIPSAIQNQRAIKIDFASYSLAAGQTETYFFSAQVPPGATTGLIGWNSFAATASQNAVQTLGAESKKVCVIVGESGCGCIGNFVWMDNNANGLQDSGEPGINGCTITLFDAANNQIGLPHISTFNMSGQPGYYQFCGLTAGSYYLVVTPPAGLMLTIQNNSNNALNSDINPGTLKSAIFQFNCQDNNDLDIGLVKDDGCDCAQSHWGNISISTNPIIIDNPHDYNGSAVNKMNKMAGASDASINKSAVVGNTGIGQPIGGNAIKLTCGQKEVTLDCNKTYSFSASYICSKPNCGSTQIVVTPPSGTSSTFTNTATFTTNASGYYTVKIYGKCGNKVCDSCEFKFKVVCPICPCEYKLGVKLGNGTQTVVNTNPKYTLHNQTFAITSPAGSLFTQVRANVVSFDLSSGFENECISCKNLPYTWGSIFNASNINTNAAVADSITMGTNPKVIQFTPTLTNTHQNPRETIWGNYSGFTLPSTLNMQFILPHPSIIGCCTLYVKICVKFTFRDRNCKECEVISCFTVAIPPQKQVVTDNPTDSPIDKDKIGTGVMKAQSNEDCATCGNNSANSLESNSDMMNQISTSKSTQNVEVISDAEMLKNAENRIKELKELKDNGVKRGDVQLLPELEKQLNSLKQKATVKK